MQAAPIYTDFNSLAAMRADPTTSEADKLENAARQFSAVFTNMLLKSMRQASLGEGIFDSEQPELYRDMFGKQIALQLNQGQSLGIAELLVNQFTSGATNQDTPDTKAAISAYEGISRLADPTQESATLADKTGSTIRNTLSSM